MTKTDELPIGIKEEPPCLARILESKIERLSNESLTGRELVAEIARARAICMVIDEIIAAGANNMTVEVVALLESILLKSESGGRRK
jgi:hypothetical protein